MSEEKKEQVFDHVIIKVINKSEKEKKNVNLIEEKPDKDVKYESMTNATYEEFLEDIQEGEYSFPNKITKIRIESKFLEKLDEEKVESFLLYNVNKSSEAKYNFPFIMKRNPMQERRDMIEFETVMSFTPNANIIFANIPANSEIIIHLF